MDDSNAEIIINDALSDVKQNCVENTNALPPPSTDSCVTKKTSFEITSITEPNIDENDDDSPDTDSHIHDHRTDNRHDVDLQNYPENMVVYNTSSDLGSTAPVIPTSSQYGLAIVDNSDSGHSLGSLKNEDLHDANSQKNEGDLNSLQNKNRNERFKVVKIESTEPFKRGRWVCMDFLDHSMNQQQPGNKIMIVNGDNDYSQANTLDTVESPLDNGYHECSEFKVGTNNVSTYTSNCNNTDNYKNQTSTYNIVSSGVTTPIHSACVSPGQSLQTNMQVPILTSQPIATVQATQPQSLTQVQLPGHHNINQSCMPSSLQSHQLQQVIANAGVMQPQLQQTQPVINVMQNQNPPIQPQSIQHLNPVDQHVTQTMAQQYQQPMPQANLQQQMIQHNNIPTQFQKSFPPQNQSVLPNCTPLQQSVNQMINQQVPQYYNSPPVQSQNVTSESSPTVPMSNQHISQQQFQAIPIQNQPLQSHVQIQQNQQQLPPPVQQMQQQPSPQQTMVQQNQMQSQMVQQNQQLSHQPSISQPSQSQQSQSVPQQNQQMSQQHIQQSQQTTQSQQTCVQQVPSSQQQQQGQQQMQQVSQQIQGIQASQIQQQLPQQTHHITQLTQMTNQTQQQMPQGNQMQQISQQSQQIPQQPQQINLQSQQIPQQTQLQHPKQMQTTQIQSQPQQINQQQIPQQQQINQITNQNQMIHQNNQQLTHGGQMISQQNQGQQLSQQNQVQQQQQPPQQQIQQQIAQTSQPGQSMTQQILQPNQSMPQQSQVLTQQLGINQSNPQMSVSQPQNQQVIQSQQPQHMQQPGQQYQQPQQMMQSQPQQIPMQTNQPIMHQSTYSQAQSLNAMQLQQAVLQIPTNTVTSTQMHIQQQQPVAQSNMMQQPQMNVMSQNNVQPTIPMSQQQMTYSLQQHVPINQNYVNSMQNCYIPSQQQMAPYKPPVKAVETVNKIKEENCEDVDNVANSGTNNSGTTTVAIDNKIEQAMDLVKSHLMYAVREEVEVLKEKIAELMDKVGLLETENSNLRMLVPPDILEQYNREKQKPTNGQSTHNQ